MLPKSVLLGLIGLVAVTDALVTPYGSVVDRRSKRQALSARQFGGGGGFRGGNGGNNGGNNNNNGGQQGGNNGGQQGGNNNNGGGGNNNGGNNNLCLDPSVIATNANNDGLANAEPGQAASATDPANFINFCKGKTITNGKQERGGSCNPVAMGEIPSADRMISAVFQNPKNGDTVQENQTFDISVQITNLQAGSFTNPQETYYNAPQALGNGGQIVGHTHVVVQDMGNSQNPNTPPSAATFAFFKGINDAGNNQGLLSATVQGGLPAGNYRLCSMTAAANHQPVLMPVAQRGPQDDCVRFTVGGGGGGGGNNGGGNNNNNGGGNNGGQQGGNNGGGNNNNGGGNNGGQQGGNNGGQQGGNNGGQQGGNNGGQQGGNNGGQQGGNNGGQQGGNNGGRGGGGGGQQGAFGGAAPAVTQSGNGDRPFAVNGNTFVNEAAAKERACDIQNNACSDAVNRGGAAFKLSDCTTQQQACIAA